jgi:deoxyribodipyrimidine photo-lyase
MDSKPSKKNSIEILRTFANKGLEKYSYLRNFDFGPEKRCNTSCLSPYVSHGILSEIDIIKKSLKENSFNKIEKFIQEILWRIYWKGWLELRPQIWIDFINDLKVEKNIFLNNENYLKAIEGKTKIECFNDWVNELKKTNYLHNHARMWFASIWIFTLKLPWQLGAEFFLENLYDGDAASNTLGWRWVGGLQTTGKHYLAKEDNIKKYTNNRYKNIVLEEKAYPLESKNQYSLIDNAFINPGIKKDRLLLIFDNNLSFETSEFYINDFKKILIVNNDCRKINLSNNVKSFKNKLMKDQQQRLTKNSIESEIIKISK